MTRLPERYTLAVVDDDRTALAILSDALSAAGFAVRAFRTAEEALTSLWDAPVDLLVVDLLLPKMNGLELVRELRARPWAAQLPVLAVTALQWGTSQVEAFEAALAPAQLLQKPVAPAELTLVVARLLRAKAERPALAVRAPAPSAPEAEAEPEGSHRIEIDLLTPRELLSEYSSNLSHDGLFVPSWAPLPAQTPVEVAIRVPFRPARVEARGEVVRAIAVESPEARTHGPGMAIALFELPEDFKRELYAYVLGLRDAAVAPASERAPRSLILVGMQGLLPREATNFLRRADLKAVWVSTIPEALGWLAQPGQGGAVVVSGQALGVDPGPRLVELSRAGVPWLGVVGGRELRGRLGPGVHLFEPGPSKLALLDALSERLACAARSAARVGCQLPMRASRVDGALAATLENLSLTGLLMTTDVSCAVGERLQVEFELPDGAGAIRGSVSALRVTRARGEGGGVSIAGTFERLEIDSVERLRRFLEGKVGPEAYRRLFEVGETRALA